MLGRTDELQKPSELPAIASLNLGPKVEEKVWGPGQGGTALVLVGQKTDLSYMYDGLTLYPKLVEAAGVDRALTKCRKEIRTFLIGDPALEDPVNKALFDEQTKTKHCIGRLKDVDGISFQRGVFSDDDDHDYYHQDEIDTTRVHHHLKFKQALTQEQFARIVHVFSTERLISLQEEQAYIVAFNERNANAQSEIKDLCERNKITDGEALRQWIASCDNNDVLIHVHSWLLGPAFDYLRERTTEDSHSKPNQEWQGTNREEKVVATSGTWAMLEKALSLQMITNLRQRSRAFSPELGQERSLQYAASHLFFGIKRSRQTNQPQPPQKSHLLEAFSEANTARLDRQHKKVFGY